MYKNPFNISTKNTGANVVRYNTVLHTFTIMFKSIRLEKEMFKELKLPCLIAMFFSGFCWFSMLAPQAAIIGRSRSTNSTAK